ncbi:MAG TPA: hypothetical protein VFK32_00250, partial [Tepidiformaceae bacterium]|nr:hypothetical protein [Tepidiformaceae bacterium]
MATSEDHESSSRNRPRVRVMAASDALSGALRMRLAEARTIAPYLARDGQLACGDIAVVSALDYPPEACRQLVASGIRVLVLAPVPRESDRKKFVDAGVLA